MDCCICYEVVDTSSNIFVMECCNNSKQICRDCLNCLRTPLCPYCRTKLPDELLQQNKNISNSVPSSYTESMSWGDFLDHEHIINPYLYNDSRRLRRQIRRLRYEHMQTVSRNNPNRLTSRERRQHRRNERQNMRDQMRQYQQEYNQQHGFRDIVTDTNNYHDDELGFEFEL